MKKLVYLLLLLDTFSVFRCGALTDAGKLALKPM
jgi:hypothetical protein